MTDDSRLPETIITEWTAQECAKFLASLGLRQYCETFLGGFGCFPVGCVGTRLTGGFGRKRNRRRGAYCVETRRTQGNGPGQCRAPVNHSQKRVRDQSEAGYSSRSRSLYSSLYVTPRSCSGRAFTDDSPTAADQSLNENATQEDVARLIQSIRLRDEKIVSVESDLRRVADDYRRLREDLLPVFKMAKDRSQPLPPPSSNIDNHFDGPPLASPGFTADRPGTGMSRQFPRRPYTGGTTPKNNSPTHVPHSILEDRAFDGSTLDPSSAGAANGQVSPGIPSPTSPGAFYQPTLGARAYSRNAQDHPEDTPTGPPPSRSERLNPTPVSGNRDTPSRSESRAGPDPPSVEIFKSFRVSMEDPCHKVLPAALKKYNIHADWRQYALYIVYGDQERCLALDERPLILFKQLEKEGRKPMFMLRKHLNPVDSGPYAPPPPNSAGFETRQGQINLPGGVL